MNRARSANAHMPGGEPGVRIDDVGRHQSVLEIEDGQLPVRRQHGPPGSFLPAQGGRPGPLPALAGQAHPSVSDDGGDVDVLEVAGPVDNRGVEAELFAFGGGQGRVQIEQAVDAEDRLYFGIGAIQLDVAEGAFGFFTALFDPRRQVRLTATKGQRLQRSLGSLEHASGLPKLVLHPAAARKGPFGYHDRLALVVRQGVFTEPVMAKGDQLPVAQRVAGPGGGVHHVRAGQGASGRHCQDGRHYQVDRDDVDYPFRDPGELPQQASGVTDDDRVGHPETPDPARVRLRKGGLDDRGPHHRHRKVAASLHQGHSPRAFEKA